MSRASYAVALDEVLKAADFTRDGKWWSRTVDGVLEQVDLQTRSVGGTTANLWSKDLETDRILENIECEEPLRIIQFGMRIGRLIDGNDRWWRDDPRGPAQLAEAVRVYGLPWFETIRSLEDQAMHYGRGGCGAWVTPNLPALAVTLYRLEATDEALSLFDEAVPKIAIRSAVVRGRCVQRWLEKQKLKAK
jgi:hypothetical protein